jgi:general secretion pathway protein G
MKTMNRNRKPLAARSAGFSLIEILIVVALIALIAGMVANQVFGGKSRANVRLAQSGIADLAGKVEQFEMDTGALPQRLEDLVKEPGGVRGWLGPYAKDSSLKDPWNTPYDYRVPGDGAPFTIISLGDDRKPGGTGVDKDLSSAD